jgi:hypothetical protein
MATREDTHTARAMSADGSWLLIKDVRYHGSWQGTAELQWILSSRRF